MTARIARSFDFQTGTYFSGDFYVNSYEVDVQFSVETLSIREQNIALERIKYYIAECLEHSIFITESDTAAIDKFLDADLKVCTLPEEPYDQIVGIMLLSKLNAITEGRLIATDISISSRMSDGVICHHDMDENLGPFRLSGWWNDSSTKITNYVSKSKGKKVVKLVKPSQEWDELDLGWDEKTLIVAEVKSNSEVVFATFDNKKDK